MTRLTKLSVIGCVLACGADSKPAFPIPGEDGQRIAVEVLNASGRAGLARAGTRVLRRAGIDVVFYGNAPPEEGALDSTRIMVRRGRAAVGEPVRSALGVGRVALVPDSASLVDVSVLLGADFVPRLDFHP